jgi:IclR family transcriptional regulator, acetate operon repressor
MQNRGQGRKPAYPIGSVGNALTLLALFRERERIRVSEAATALGTARSTAHRLLAMLEYHGFARQDPETQAYRPGPLLLELGLSALGSLDIRGLLRPALEGICREVGETAHLVVLEGGSVVFLDSVETTRALRIGSRAGRIMLAHCTASGKAILAGLSPGELRGLYPGGPLERMTGRSLSSLVDLERDLEEVRRAGFATNFGESEDELAAVAVAIPGRPGGRLAAITVSAPLTRLRPEQAAAIAEVAHRVIAELVPTTGATVRA